MIELSVFALGAAAIASWYCYRWGRSDGYAKGYAAGLFEGAADDESNASPSAAGAARAGGPYDTDLGGGPRERA